MVPLAVYVVSLIVVDAVIIQLLLKCQKVLLVGVLKNLWLLIEVSWMHDRLNQESSLLLYLIVMKNMIRVISVIWATDIRLGFDS